MAIPNAGGGRSIAPPLAPTAADRRWWAQGLTALAHGWQRIRAITRTLVLIRFSLVLAAGCGWALLANDQAQDGLRLMAEDPGPQIIAFVLAALFCATVVWYSARVMYYFDFGPAADAAPEIRWLKAHLPRVMGAAVLVLPAFAFAAAATAYEPPYGTAPQLLGALAAAHLLLAAGFYVAVLRRRQWLIRLARRRRWLRPVPGARFARPPERLRSIRDLPLTGRLFLTFVAVVGLGLMLHFAADAVVSARLFGAGAIALLAVASAQPIGSLLDYVGNRFQLPTLIVALLWAITIAFVYDHHLVRVAPGMASHKVPPGSPAPAAANPEPKAHFERWLAPLQAGQRGRIPVFVIAAEGGGIRAAYWTAQVLGELQDRACRQGLNFARHAFAISGVSGGSLGAAVFAGLIADHVAQHGTACPGDPDYRARAERILAGDFLSPTLAVMLFADTFQLFLPLGLDDRAITLETAWEDAWQDGAGSARFGAPFLDLWSGEARYEVPVLLLNSTVVETGQRLIAAPIDIREPIFSDALDATRALGGQLPLSTAVHNSARFAYISPAGTVRRRDQPGQWLRLVDGGYFENSGAVTAAEIIHLVRNHAAASPVAVEPIVIHISNDPESFGPAQPSQRRVVLNQARAPIEALFNTRPARGKQAREALSRQVAHHLHFRLCRGAASAPLPLGWALSSVARRELLNQLGVTQDASKPPIARRNAANFTAALTLLEGGAIPPSGTDNWGCPLPEDQG